jgi:TetR/AcrR family transcriptional regulator, transcriptional repressor for nem operon
MKVSKEVVAQHRENLLEAAGRLMRERGLDKVGVAEVAAAAGLTHGAVYTHFPSKQALCRAAVTRMLEQSAGKSGRQARKAYVEAYLSPRHALRRKTGCPYAALASEIPRASTSIRAAFSQELERTLEVSANQLGGRDQAIVSMALMVGSVVLARASIKRELRDEILAATKQQLLK